MADATRYIIANTDPNWLSYLEATAPREVNFWRPGAPPMNVTPGTPWFYKLRGSSQIRERYENGRDYYALEGRSIRLPVNERQRPLLEHLDYHSSEIFQP